MVEIVKGNPGWTERLLLESRDARQSVVTSKTQLTPHGALMGESTSPTKSSLNRSDGNQEKVRRL